MGIFDFLRLQKSEAPVQAIQAAQTIGETGYFDSLKDPYLAEFVRSGAETESGAVVTVEAALKNPTVFRCVALTSFSVGMLPLTLYESGPEKRKAIEHPVYRLLHRQPNDWQTAIEFRQLMQGWALIHGDAIALKVFRGRTLIALIPIKPERITIEQDDDFSLRYKVTLPSGATRVLQQSEVFHVRGFTTDGVTGRSLVRQAAEFIGLAIQTQKAAARLFRNGVMVGGALKHPDQLSQEAHDRLKADMEARYSGAENSQKWMILEEGMEAQQFAQTAKDSQHIETRKLQIEELARIFGTPRPLLMTDETSWGSGIDVLGQLFVRYGLNPWFQSWEQAISRDLLREDEKENYYAKFNAGALLRGNMKDQAEYFAKALGSGGHQPWMHQDEVRDLSELPERDDLAPPAGTQTGDQSDDASQNTED